MTNAERGKLALPAPNNDIKNDAPPELLELAKLAIFAGFREVYIGFEGLGADEPSPIGWLLHLTKRDRSELYLLNGSKHVETDESKLDERMQFRVTTSRQGLIGEGTYLGAEAYVGEKQGYWGAAKIREWITTEHFLASAERNALGLRSGDKLITEDAAQAAYERLETGYINGWSAQHELRLDNALAMRRYADPEEPSFGNLFLTIEASNNFYSTAGHPQHRASGGKLNVSHQLMMVDTQSADLGADAMMISHEDYEEIKPGRADRFEDSPFYRALTNTAPWFVRVAGQVEDDEEAETEGYWVFAPESRPEFG